MPAKLTRAWHRYQREHVANVFVYDYEARQEDQDASAGMNGTFAPCLEPSCNHLLIKQIFMERCTGPSESRHGRKWVR